MKIQTLQALIAAVNEGSLRAAARQMGLSQPALSKMMRELESELGTPLFERSSKGVQLTGAGQVLYQHAHKASLELEQARQHIREMAGQVSGALHIGAVPVAVMLLVPQALRSFSKEFARVNLHITEELYFDQLQRLRKGEVDLAVGGVPEGLAPGEFQIERLIETTMVLVVKKGHPALRQTTLAALTPYKWIYTGQSQESGYARQLFQSHGLPPPKLGATVNSTLALISLLATGEFIGMLPHQIAQHRLVQQQLAVLPIAEQGVPIAIHAIVRSDRAMLAANRQFIAHLHRAAHQAGRNETHWF